MSGASHQALLMVGEDKDPFYAQVKVLNHFDGTVGATTITDSGPLAIPSSDWIRTNSPTLDAIGKFSQSMRFSGSTAYIDGKTYLNPGTSDWTLECWCNIASTSSFSSGEPLIEWTFTSSSSNPIVNFIILHGGGVQTFGVDAYVNGVYTPNIAISSQILFDQWTHLAATRQGTTFRAFVNGVQTYTNTMTGTFGTTAGKLKYSGQFATTTTKRIDEVRLTIGTARYTSNFAPPSNPFPNQ